MVIAHNIKCQITKKMAKFLYDRKNDTSKGGFSGKLEPVYREIEMCLETTYKGPADFRTMNNILYTIICDTVRDILTEITSSNCLKNIIY